MRNTHPDINRELLDHKEYWTVQEAASYLAISKKTFEAVIKGILIPIYMPYPNSQAHMIKRDDIHELLKGNRNASVSEIERVAS